VQNMVGMGKLWQVPTSRLVKVPKLVVGGENKEYLRLGHDDDDDDRVIGIM
jgi:hypothetical protein